MAIESTDWIAIGISLVSVGVAAIALIDSRNARKKVYDLDQEKFGFDQVKHGYQMEKDLAAETREFLHRTLRSSELLDARYHLVRIHCSQKRGDSQTSDDDYKLHRVAETVHKSFMNIASELNKYSDFIKEVSEGEFIVIINCDKILTELGFFNNEDRKKLVEIARVELEKKNVNINDIDPCKNDT